MTKPNITIPSSFAANGDKTDFDENHITNGFPTLTPDVLRGDNLNKFIDDTYKGLNGVLELYKGAVLYDVTETYSNTSIVFYIDTNDNNKIKIYHSLQNGNINHALTDADYWEEVNLGGSTRNIGEIVTSTLPLTDAGLHLLDGTRLSGDGIYKEFVDYIGELYENTPSINEANVIKPSTLAYNDGVLSGFSTNSYAQLPNSFVSSEITEAQICFTTGSDITTTQGLFLGTISDDTSSLGIYNGGLYLINKVNNSTPSYVSLGLPLSTNTKYYFKFTQNTTSITPYISTDGENYTEGTTVNRAKDFGNFIGYGLSNDLLNTPFLGSIDLKESYININNSLWWSGIKVTKPSFCTEAEWQQSVADYGVCGKFVYDSTLNTVRLPKVTGIIEGTTDVTALGDLVRAGLPDIEGTLDIVQTTGTTTRPAGGSGAFLATEVSRTPTSGASGSKYYNIAPHFKASYSNPIYGNSTTVQPQTIKCYYYIVIATSIKTDIQVDIDEIATDLNGKADVDLTNVNDTGYIKMAGASMPSDTYVDLTLGASGATYTAPANGWVFFYKATSTACQSAIRVYRNNNLVYVCAGGTDQSGTIGGVFAPLLKGDNFQLNFDHNGNLVMFRFVYAKGSESEAS